MNSVCKKYLIKTRKRSQIVLELGEEEEIDHMCRQRLQENCHHGFVPYSEMFGNCIVNNSNQSGSITYMVVFFLVAMHLYTDM